MAKNSSVGVVYLARHADGIAAFRRFADSYRRHPAGMGHDLVVIYKGFEQQSHLQQAREVFREHPHKSIELQDSGFDIGSYLECSRRVAYEYLYFLNTHSEIVAPGWVALPHDFAVRSGVGLVGAMGSYESLRQSWELIQKFYWLYYMQGFPYEAPVAQYYVKFPEYLPPRKSYLHWRKLLPKSIVAASYRSALVRFEKHWEELLRRDVFRAIATFPKFPNPHIRSNAFMVRRDRLSLFNGETIASKDDACFFESGPNSLTARIRRSGLAAVVVGRNGEGYDVPQWPESETFRLGDQANLLVTDNHGRGFLDMTTENRLTHARMTWGDYLGPMPERYPTLGIGFARSSLAPAGISDAGASVRP